MQRGFSLVELMVAVALLAIVTSFAVPAFRNTVIQNRLAGVTNSLIGAVELARSEAVRRRVLVELVSDGSWAQGWTVRCVDTPADPDSDPDCPDIVNYRAPPGISLALTYSVSSPPTNLLFNSRGLRQPVSDVSFTLCDVGSKQGRTIALNPSGEVSITVITSGCV